MKRSRHLAKFFMGQETTEAMSSEEGESTSQSDRSSDSSTESSFQTSSEPSTASEAEGVVIVSKIVEVDEVVHVHGNMELGEEAMRASRSVNYSWISEIRSSLRPDMELVGMYSI